MSAALLLIDLQNDFCPQGALAVSEGDRVIPIALDAIKQAQQNSVPVIATQDWHPAHHGSFASQSGGKIGEMGELAGLEQIWWPDHCIQGSEGAEFHPQLNAAHFDHIVHKGTDATIDSYSAFFDNGRRASTELHSWLQRHQIDTLYMMGLATDYCVKYSVMDALHLGYRVVVITDGCRGVNIKPEDSKIALQQMQTLGATLMTLSDVRF
ncbi:PncA [Hafnia alvei FB1]|jgi:nicotinamidase/pyrazinamidase|uniref:Nicotinamidase n=1 Tax=Hafnia alvei FB1 TaxID=1453496 RepID=A0A097R1U6_HAFAL|nr:bifunctional nicotinamidase/pyrazinamidase [Hafnia alvei]AIU72691.1 PncA [Hafnia alvei FB1]TBL57622.1 bifunctional nicotinamidase/pyrazinamidase [Hafnia alvei]